MFRPTKSDIFLSAFDNTAARWKAISLHKHTETLRQTSSPRVLTRRAVPERVTLTSWNIHASQYKRVERSRLILDHILESSKRSDIIFLQEVASDVRQSVLDDPRVRSRFLTSDAENDKAFKNVPFATMTLLSHDRFASPITLLEEKEDSRMVLHSAFRMTLPSRYDRDALCINVYDPAALPNLVRLINVHLDSLESWFRRTFEVHLLNALLREEGCTGGVIAGDFNAIEPTDRTLVEEHALVDAWTKLHGQTKGTDGATWGVGFQLEEGREPGRLDKVVMLSLEPVDIEVLQPGRTDNGTPWSDHCGLRCTFIV